MVKLMSGFIVGCKYAVLLQIWQQGAMTFLNRLLIILPNENTTVSIFSIILKFKNAVIKRSVLVLDSDWLSRVLRCYKIF